MAEICVVLILFQFLFFLVSMLYFKVEEGKGLLKWPFRVNTPLLTALRSVLTGLG